MTTPLVLVVLDGFGLGDGGPADATALGDGQFFARAERSFPKARIATSGEAVGLPPGQMGNSEVGHMTMGAGRIIEQDMTRISHAIERGELETNGPIQEALSVAKRGGHLHLMGLVSDGGVHSHQDHLVALLELCGRRGVRPVLHAFLDGRDTPPSSGLSYLRALVPHVQRAGGEIATVSGRYYAMDRDRRWKRTARAYAAIVARRGHSAPDAVSAVERAYARGESDEFVEPVAVDGGSPLRDGDAVLFFNFRADRARQLTNAITGACPELFDDRPVREPPVRPGIFVCLTEYDAGYGLPVAFPTFVPRQILGQVVAEQGLAQLRIAETEKYAHVTFFFNGGNETPYPGEDRVLIPSPRDVATYDHKPEMSAMALTEEALRRISDDDYAFILLNYANPDMVGHTGVLDAAVKAVETVDRGLERLAEAVLARRGTLLVTADHGNCELMVDPQTGEPHTAHTTNPVPIFWIAGDVGSRRLRDGGLADIAPTALELLGLPVPDEMTGRSLIVPG
jgi:2,3-bisphosphoglycerate-independent phosphoglycerate mutase